MCHSIDYEEAVCGGNPGEDFVVRSDELTWFQAWLFELAETAGRRTRPSN